MKKPAQPANESERLAQLRAYKVLDTLPDEAFEEITALASEICDTPIALISLIDEDRQWFKSRRGLDAPETSREISFCGHAILENQVMVVEDALKDERFHDNPLVTGKPKIRFYAGAPLTTPTGQNIGTLCVISPQPQNLSDKQIRALSILSHKVISELERQKAFEHISRMKEKLEEAQKIAHLGSWEWDLKTDTFQFSDSLYEILGIDKSLGPSQELFFKYFSPASKKAFLDFIHSVDSEKKVFHLDQEASLSDGRLSYLKYSLQVSLDRNGKPEVISGTTLDITDSKLAEQLAKEQQAKLITASKLAALGEMASGVAHEINNPLAIINARVHIMRKQAEQGTAAKEAFVANLDKIEDTVARIAKIIRGLRAFSRDASKDALQPMPLHHILKETLDLCQEKFSNNGVDLRMGDLGNYQVYCRVPQLTQVFMNLLSNAFDATELLRDKWIQVNVENKKNRILISVTDSGSGIRPEVAAKMMQPFFTTKEVGKGTGLGLSICRGIAEEHGGTLYYDPQCANTRFVLELPLQKPD